MSRRYSKKKRIEDNLSIIEMRLSEIKSLLGIAQPITSKAHFNVSKIGKLFTYNSAGKRIGGARVVSTGDVIEYNPSECFFRIK